MLYRRLAGFAIRNAGRIIVCWLVVAEISAVFAVRLPNVLGDHGLKTRGAYSDTQRLLAEAYPPADSERTVGLLFENDRELIRTDFRALIARMLEQAGSLPGIDVTASPLTGAGMEDGRYAYALLRVPEAIDERREAIAAIDNLSRHASGMSVGMTGKPVVQLDVNRSSGRDLKAAETLGLPVAFALLLLTFGGVVPALVPIVSGLIAVTISMGVLYAIGASGLVELSSFVHNVVPMVGMAVCVDFALLMVSRFREESAFFGIRKAMANTLASSGRAVTISACCVVLALVGTFIIRMPIFNSVALGAIVVLLVSLLVNLTFVPALLSAMGDRLAVDLSIFGRPSRAMRVFLSAVMSRPRSCALMASALLVLCLLPVQSMRLSVPGPESLPAHAPSRIAAATIAERFAPPNVSQAFLFADARIAKAIEGELARDAGVVRYSATPAPAASAASPGSVLFTVMLYGEASSDEAMRWMRERGETYAGLGASVGGEPKYHQEVHDEIVGRIKYVLAFVVASNYFLLALAFRSLLIPAKAIAMNLLSIGSSLGIVAWLFQEGRWGLAPSDIAIMIPIFVFGLAFGVSMDYGIFLLSRIEESYRRTGDNERAVREGLAVSGRIITSAAAIMIAATAPFAIAGVTGVKQLGIGIAAALLVDATIVRMVLLPSLMKMFGRWNWWLPFVRSYRRQD
ncbi:MMPL family transporter [Cohnella sp. GCM10027633]|uniref:MMPL family transporter n=1 Tax=unclassified Cohnella TaxID=2636738 RepID=UPI00363A6C9C